MENKRINNFRYFDLVRSSNTANDIFYKELFSIKYPTIIMVGASRSGKGELLRNILYHITLPWETKLYILSPNHDDDKSYRRLKEMMKDFNEIVFSKEPEDLFFDKLYNERNKKENKYGAENIVIFDDISNVLRNNKEINYLSTHNRHQKTLMIVSTQSFTDLNPKLRSQATHVILFGNLRNASVKSVYNDYISSNFDLEEDQFLELYKERTKEKYTYIVIDLIEKKIRRDMNEIIDI